MRKRRRREKICEAGRKAKARFQPVRYRSEVICGGERGIRGVVHSDNKEIGRGRGRNSRYEHEHEHEHR